MTRISEQDLAEALAGNPDIWCAETVVRRSEPERAQRYRAAHSIGLPAPTEAQEQRTVVSWAEKCAGQWPELHLLYHIPNGGERKEKEGALLYAEGVKAGVPDLCLPVARGGYTGLWIEMKRADHSNNPSAKQKWWIDRLRREGHRCEVCYGASEAIDVLQDYLKGE